MCARLSGITVKSGVQGLLKVQFADHFAPLKWVETGSTRVIPIPDDALTVNSVV